MRISTCITMLGVVSALPSAVKAETCPILTPSDAAACAVATSPTVQAERGRLQSLAGRRIAASALLPSQPELSVSLAERRLWQPQAGSTNPTLNFYITLAQTIEVGGQRGLRINVVSKETDAQMKRLAFVELAVAADAAETAHRVIAENERATLSQELAAVGAKLLLFANGRAEQAMLSAVDEDLLVAEATRMSATALHGTMRLRKSEAQFRALVGRSAPEEWSSGLTKPAAREGGAGQPSSLPQAQLERPLPPLPSLSTLEESATLRRADLLALRAERDVASARAELLSRERIPNITVQGIVQSDGFGERVLGGGISLPLFLPSPLAPSRRGELDEARARSAALEADGDAMQRTVRAEVAAAFAYAEAARATLALFPAARSQRMRAELAAVAEAMTSGKLPPRDALYTARALIDYCERAIDAKLDAALSQIALARAAALPLEEVLP